MGNELGRDERKPGDREFPKRLEGFGYEFNDQGELRNIENGKRFVFVVRDGDRQYNELHYEALGEVITVHVYQLLEKAGLQPVYLPVDAEVDEPLSFVFRSQDFFDNSDKLMILIHGSGVVRAGQWARRLIINDNLRSGTQLPFINRAMKKGYSVLVLNTNLNRAVPPGGKRESAIRGNDTPEAHAVYVWQHLVRKCPAKTIDIVAHSAGGCATVEVIKLFPDARQRVQHIAFTDSVHTLGWRCSNEVSLWFQEHAINWVSSDEPLDTVLSSFEFGQDAQRRSAGVAVHEMTSWSAFQSIFKYFAEGDGDEISRSEKNGDEREPLGRLEGGTVGASARAMADISMQDSRPPPLEEAHNGSGELAGPGNEDGDGGDMGAGSGKLAGPGKEDGDGAGPPPLEEAHNGSGELAGLGNEDGDGGDMGASSGKLVGTRKKDGDGGDMGAGSEELACPGKEDGEKGDVQGNGDRESRPEQSDV